MNVKKEILDEMSKLSRGIHLGEDLLDNDVENQFEYTPSKNLDDPFEALANCIFSILNEPEPKTPIPPRHKLTLRWSPTATFVRNELLDDLWRMEEDNIHLYNKIYDRIERIFNMRYKRKNVNKLFRTLRDIRNELKLIGWRG